MDPNEALSAKSHHHAVNLAILTAAPPGVLKLLLEHEKVLLSEDQKNLAVEDATRSQQDYLEIMTNLTSSSIARHQFNFNYVGHRDLHTAYRRQRQLCIRDRNKS